LQAQSFTTELSHSRANVPNGSDPAGVVQSSAASWQSRAWIKEKVQWQQKHMRNKQLPHTHNDLGRFSIITIQKREKACVKHTNQFAQCMMLL